LKTELVILDLLLTMHGKLVAPKQLKKRKETKMLFPHLS
jgi:hypothetical protein